MIHFVFKNFEFQNLITENIFTLYVRLKYFIETVFSLCHNFQHLEVDFCNFVKKSAGLFKQRFSSRVMMIITRGDKFELLFGRLSIHLVWPCVPCLVESNPSSDEYRHSKQLCNENLWLFGFGLMKFLFTRYLERNQPVKNVLYVNVLKIEMMFTAFQLQLGRPPQVPPHLTHLKYFRHPGNC